MTKVQTKAQTPEVGGRKKPKRQPKISRGPYGLTIQEAGALIGLGRAASYRAVEDGRIPIIRVGSLKIVPRALWLRQLGIDDVA
jgi:excisionase family DNA binding protein